MYATKNENINIIKLLLNKEAALKNSNGDTALMLASQ